MRRHPIRSISGISDELWAKVKKRADERNESISEAVRKFLERYSK